MWKASEKQVVIYFDEDGLEIGYGTVEMLDLYLKDLGSIGVDALVFNDEPERKTRYKGFRFFPVPGCDRTVAIGKFVHTDETENFGQWKARMQAGFEQLRADGDIAGGAWIAAVLDEGKCLGYVTMEMHTAVACFWKKKGGRKE